MALIRSYDNQDSDRELIKRYRHHEDKEALGILFNRYADLVYGLSLKYYKDSTLAKDSVMDIFELVGKKLLTHEIENFKSWLYSVSKNHCFEQLRKKNRSLTKESDANYMYSEQVFHPDDIENEEEIKKLRLCIEKLPEKQQASVTEFYINQRSYEEVAAILKVEWNKVRSYIQNGRRNLKNCMERDQKE